MSQIGKWIVCLALINSPAIAGDHYKIDSDHTFSSFEYTRWGVLQQSARFDLNSGVIDFDPEAKTGSIEIEIGSASVNTGSDFYNTMLRSENFFDAVRYPMINFKSAAMHFDGDQLVRIDGALTIKDIVRPVSFEITHFECSPVAQNPVRACLASGITKILRSDFNVGRNAPFVSDEVTLQFSVRGIHE